jgi:hypothetical protein
MSDGSAYAGSALPIAGLPSCGWKLYADGLEKSGFAEGWLPVPVEKIEFDVDSYHDM